MEFFMFNVENCIKQCHLGYHLSMLIVIDTSMAMYQFTIVDVDRIVH
jgi:hypothetical protein